MVKIDTLIRFNIRVMVRSLSKGCDCEGTCCINDEPAFSWYYHPALSLLYVSYTINDKPYRYQIQIESRSSNLGISGKYYYFICPETGRRCRLLYLYKGRFVSRFAIPKVMYRCQYEQADAVRFYETMIGGFEAVRRYGKEYYRGRITPYGRRLKRLIDKTRKARCREYSRGSDLGRYFEGL